MDVHSPPLVIGVDSQSKPIQQPLPWLFCCLDDTVGDVEELILVGLQSHAKRLLRVADVRFVPCRPRREVVQSDLALQGGEMEEGT